MSVDTALTVAQNVLAFVLLLLVTGIVVYEYRRLQR